MQRTTRKDSNIPNVHATMAWVFKKRVLHVAHGDDLRALHALRKEGGEVVNRNARTFLRAPRFSEASRGTHRKRASFGVPPLAPERPLDLVGQRLREAHSKRVVFDHPSIRGYNRFEGGEVVVRLELVRHDEQRTTSIGRTVELQGGRRDWEERGGAEDCAFFYGGAWVWRGWLVGCAGLVVVNACGLRGQTLTVSLFLFPTTR